MRHAPALQRLRRIGAAATESRALRSAALAEIGRAAAGCFETAGRSGTLEPGPVILLLDAGLRVLGQTPPTDDYLARLLPDTDTRPIPAAAYNVAAQLVAVENGIDRQPALARMHLAGGRWLTMRAARLGPAFDQDARIAVTLEDSSLSDRAAMLARACGLTARETELLSQLSTGADTRTIAARMFLTENTVQDHLKSIFDKTGTRSRRALLSRAAGTG